MRNSTLKLFSIYLVAVVFVQAKDRLQLAEGKMFECSLYGNMTSIDNNIYLQTDIGLGVNFMNYCNSTATVNIQYRNYSTITNDFITISGGAVFRKNEVRIGLVGGLYTLSFSGYRDVILCGGGELIYAYNITSGVSFRLKERIVMYSEENNSTVGTSSFIGFCFAFLDSGRGKKK
jgi:hypothetical protein